MPNIGLPNRLMRSHVRDMARRAKPPREKAARALCKMDGHQPDINFDGEPMWKNYLRQVDMVLRTVIGDNAWMALVEVERETG